MYAGRASGTHYNHRGGAADKICLPDNPDYLNGTSRQEGTTTVAGSEYEFHSDLLSNLHNHNAPCAVCYVPTRATTIMVPAKTACPSSWTREYYGYLTTESSSDHRSLYTCIDINPEVIAGTSANTNPARIFLASTDCSGLLCPPYENNRVLSCAVCTK